MGFFCLVAFFSFPLEFNGSELGAFRPRRYWNIYMLIIFVVRHQVVWGNHRKTARCFSFSCTSLCP